MIILRIALTKYIVLLNRQGEIIMINIDMKPLLKGGISRYSLVVGVAKRSREIADEVNERNEKITEKTVSLAVNELLDGKFSINEPDDAHKI